MGVLQARVHPGLGLSGQLGLIEFPHREHHLAVARPQVVTVDVHVGKAVVLAQLLQLGVDLGQGARIPEAQVGQGGLVIIEHRLIDLSRLQVTYLLQRGQRLDLVQTVGGAGGGQVARYIWLLPVELVRLDREILHECRVDHAQQQGGDDQDAQADSDRAQPSENDPGEYQRRDGQRQHHHDLQHRQHDDEVGVARPPVGLMLVEQQQVGAQPVNPGLQHQQSRQQQGQVQLDRRVMAPAPLNKLPADEEEIGNAAENQRQPQGSRQQ